MDSTEISESIRKLAADNTKRTKTAQLNDVLDDVEFALRNGVSRQAILEQLAECGLEMTMRCFESALYKLRKRKKRQTQVIEPVSISVPNKASPAEKTLNANSSPVMPLPKTKEEREEFAKSFVNKKDTSLLDRLNKGKSK